MNFEKFLRTPFFTEQLRATASAKSTGTAQKMKLSLMILRGKNSVLLNSAQEFIEIEAWLLLTFFLCLRNQLSSINSTTVTH